MRRWTKIALGAVGAFVAIGVIAVATGPTQPQAAPSTAPATPAAAASVDPAAVAADPAVHDAAFLMALDQKGIPYTTPQAAEAAGHAICGAYQSGATTLDIAGGMAGTHYTDAQKGSLIGISAAAYCPQFTPQ